MPEETEKPASARRDQLRRYASFAVAGGTGFVVDAAVLSLGLATGLAPWIARIPSFLAAVATTWIINRTFTFQTDRPPSWREFARYFAAMSLGLAVNYSVFLLVLRLSAVAASWPVLALVPATLAGMGLNYLTSSRILKR